MNTSPTSKVMGINLKSIVTNYCYYDDILDPYASDDSNPPTPVAIEVEKAYDDAVFYGTLTSPDWVPMDDGIKVTLPGVSMENLSRDDVDCYIQGVLYGKCLKKRLPVFVEVCTEEESLGLECVADLMKKTQELKELLKIN